MRKCEMCGCSPCNCGSGKCGSSKCDSASDFNIRTGDMMSDKMAMLADKAWEELLIEKMKLLWEKEMGQKMDGIAEATIEISKAYHTNQMKGNIEVSEAVGKLKQAFA